MVLKYRLTRKQQEDVGLVAKLNRSIHPFGRPVRRSIPAKRRSTIERVIAAIEKHLLRHPYDHMSAARLPKLKAQL